MRRMGIVGVVLGGLLLTGCAGDPAVEPTEADTGIPLATAEAEVVAPGECEQVFAELAESGTEQAAPEDLWPAFSACEDLEAFTAAADLNPDALGGADPTTYATEECESEPEVADSPVCASL